MDHDLHHLDRIDQIDHNLDEIDQTDQIDHLDHDLNRLDPSPPLRRCLGFTRFCWVGKHIPRKYFHETGTNSPTQGQSNPKKT